MDSSQRMPLTGLFVAVLIFGVAFLLRSDGLAILSMLLGGASGVGLFASYLRRQGRALPSAGLEERLLELEEQLHLTQAEVARLKSEHAFDRQLFSGLEASSEGEGAGTE